ncbi:MAG: transposase [Chloroflexi bacterium]|nr:transposase [Chloroflexota bacterium]
MTESNHSTSSASLAMLGLQFQHWQIWPVVSHHVKIKQKIRMHTPLEKLQDCFVNILAGGHGLVEINTRLRADPGLQRAFGRATCAEQSTISDTLNACTPENVQQMQQALAQLIRQHSQTFRHAYSKQWQLFDIDMTGLCAGRLGEGVTKGYFAHRKNARGRQLGRVIGTHYDEVITERLFPGKRQLEKSLLELVDATSATLELDENKRKNTLLRIDGGGGSEANINALLARQYQVLVKVHNWQRARKLAETVQEWWCDPKVPEREVGWVRQPYDYVRATQQLAIRKRKNKDEWSYAVIVSSVSNRILQQLNGQRVSKKLAERERAWLILHAYDLRGGGAETQNKSDKQGLGLAKRNKHKFAAQEMLVLLAQLAHNLVIWTRNALARATPGLAKYGIHRMVRDVLRIPGQIRFDAVGKVQITLSENHPLAQKVLNGFRAWLPRDDLSLNLGKI